MFRGRYGLNLLLPSILFIATSPAAAQVVSELDKLKQGLQKTVEKDRIDAIQKWKGPDADADKAAKIFVNLLNDKSAPVQQAAIAALVKIGEKAADPVGQALQPGNAQVRKNGLRILEQLGPKGKQAAPAVVKILTGPMDPARADVQRVLTAMGPGAVPAVLELLKNNEKVARDILRQMGAAGTKEALPQLIESTKSKDADVRRGAALVLGALGAESKPALPALAVLMRDPDDKVREQAKQVLPLFHQDAYAPLLEQLKIVEGHKYWPGITELLVRLGAQGQKLPPGMADVLAKHLAHKDADVRTAALDALQPFAYRAKDMVAPLAPLLGDKEEKVRKRAASNLDALHMEAIATLLKELKSPNEDIRLGTLSYLVRYGWRSREWVSDLVPLLADTNPKTRQTAAELLRQAQSADAMWPLAVALTDEKIEVRKAAAKTLTDLNWVVFPATSDVKEKGIAALIKSVADPEPQIKKAAVDALQRAGAQPAVSLALLKSNDNALRVVAAKAIAASGKCDQEAIGLLIAAMKDAHAGMRDDSTTALVRLGKTAIPALAESAQGGDKAAIKVIGRMGMPGVASLLELANFKDLPVRLAAIEVLGDLQTFPPTYLPALRKLAQEDRQVEVRDAAMRVLLGMELRNPNPNSRAMDVELLLRGLQDKDWASRRESSLILANLKGAAVPGMVEKLVEIVEKNPDAAIRSETIHTLGMIGPRAAGAVKPLIDLVRSDKAENVPLRARALAALDKMHPEADAGLLGILIDADVALQVAVLQMLRTEQVKTAKDLIVDMLRSKNPEIRTASAQALGKLGSPIAKDLAPLLEDKEGDIRAAAVLAMEDFATAETLGKYLRDEKLAVRETAARALAKKGVRAHGVLAEALSSKDYRVQVAAANAIAVMDNRDGVDDRADALLPDLIVVFLAKGGRDPELQAAARAIHGINPILAARQIAAKAEVPDLIEMLKRSAPEVRELACLALAEKGPDAAVALPALTDLLKQPTTDVIVLAAAARAVQVISPPRKLGVNENDDRLPPDVGLRLAKGTHAKSTQLREEIMESLQKQFSPTRDNSAEVILAALHLGQRTDDVNSWLIDFADSTDLTDAVSPNFVRILALYHANKMAAARLTPAAELALKEQFWRYLKNRGPLVNSPANLKVSLTAVLEKEELVARITSYLAMEVMMDDPAFKDRFLANRTLQDLHQGWTVWWREWAKDRAMRGLWSEMGWPAHQMVIWPCLLNMYDCAGDAVVKQQFKMLLDLTAIEEEQISIHGTRAGRRGKSNGVGSGLDPWKDVLQGQRPRRTGEADSGLGGIVWTSGYQLPTAAILLRHLERPVPSFTITNRVVTPQSGTNRPAGNVVAHVTPHYVLGSQFAPIAGTMEPFGNWHRLVFDDMKAIFYPLTTGERLHFQHDNICISTWTGIAVEPQMIHFSSDLKQVEKDGWLFLSNGPAFAALYVENGYDLERAPVKAARPGLDTITLKEPRAIVVLQAGDVHKFGSFEKFQEAILKAPLKMSAASVHFTGPQAEAVEFFRRGNAVITKPVQPKATMTYDSPYLRGQAGQPQITVRFGSYSAVYDFENNAITEGK